MKSWLLWEFPESFQSGIQQLFFWSGVAIWVGLAARFLVPAKVVKGPWLTFVLGFVGSCLGPLATSAIFRLENFNPIGPAGFVVSTLVAVLTLLLFYVVSFFFPANLDEDETEDDEDEEEDDEERRQEEPLVLARPSDLKRPVRVSTDRERRRR